MVLCPSELKLGREMWTHPGRVNSQKLDFAGSLEFATRFENVLTNGSTLQSVSMTNHEAGLIMTHFLDRAKMKRHLPIRILQTGQQK